MADPYSGATGTTKQELNILNEVKQRQQVVKGQTIGSSKEEAKGKEKKGRKTKDKEPPTNLGTLYSAGIKLMELHGYIVELDESGFHVNHRILKPTPLTELKGISYPASFQPLQDIHALDDLDNIDRIFNEGVCGAEVREFWMPLFRPQVGESTLSCFTARRLKMKDIQKQKEIHDVLHLGHTFDPAGKMGGDPVYNPRVWVPDRSWFNPVLYDLKFSDVFTIFPPAEQELLKLIIGRIGVGRSNHLPPGRKDPVKHTARMAAIIVGKDAGLGKSTLFNGMTAAFSKCGFITHTFKDVEDRFGMKSAALSNISYKDDTSLPSLKKFLASESTKILVTNGIFQTEEKFQNPEQIQPRTVIIANSNDWNSKFAYDLDPGIIDRIKVISTYREYEVMANRDNLSGTISEGSPDLRPYAHIPYLANKLGVSEDAIYLWCLRLATDRFWEVINDNSDPMINRLQVEVRYWTSRQRIKFKSDVIQAIVNAMAFSYALRTGMKGNFMPELSPYVLLDYLRALYFVAVDPSCQPLAQQMKESWEKAGRPSTHYYQGFRELRWESVKIAISLAKSTLFDEETGRRIDNKESTSLKTIKEIVETLVLRDGHKMGGEANYVIENWQNCRHAQEELVVEAEKLLEGIGEEDLKRIRNLQCRCEDDWLNNKMYSPDSAERFREKAREKLVQSRG